MGMTTVINDTRVSGMCECICVYEGRGETNDGGSEST